MSDISLREVSRREFDKFSNNHVHGSWLQTSQMSDLRTSLGWRVEFLGIYKGGNLIGITLLSNRRGRFETTMGPLIDWSDDKLISAVIGLIRDHAKSSGAESLHIYPPAIRSTRDDHGEITSQNTDEIIRIFTKNNFKHTGFSTGIAPIVNRLVYIKSLSEFKSEHELLYSYRGTRRREIQHLDASKYRVGELTRDQLPVLFSLLESSNQKNHAVGRDIDYLEKLYDALGQNSKFMVVYYQGTPISGAIFIYHKQEVVYFLSGTDTNYRKQLGAHFLQHHILADSLKKGYPKYNFYGITGDFKNDPLLKFKAGFRGYIEEYYGEFYVNFKPGKLFIKKAARRIKGIVK